MKKDKIYFASDFHLGSPNIEESHQREKLIVSWLNKIEQDAIAIYLLGDIFDFWFEYKKVIPKGFVRLLGKLAALADNGVQIHLFGGNHDLWMRDYLEKEIGIVIHHKPTIIEVEKKKIFIGHGDGLGKGDHLYKFTRKIFASKTCQWIFARLHPNLAISLAHAWSKRSRKNHEAPFISQKEEKLFGYCKEQQKIRPNDYYIFGHRHIPLELKIDEQATYFNLGDWVTHNTYAILKNGVLQLKKYQK